MQPKRCLRRHPRKTIAGLLSLALIAAWLTGDFVYSFRVARAVKAWEATQTRDESGVIEGAQAFSMGEGETAILLVHGINASPCIWRNIAPALAAEGFAVRAMRLPGFAEPMSQYAAATKEDWLAAVDEEVARLRESHPRVILVGHSLGGAITIAYSLQHPKAVDALVLLAPAVEVSSERSPVLPVRCWHEFARWTLAFTWLTESPFEPDCHDPAGRVFVGQSPFTPVATVDETFAVIDHNRVRATEISVPLLMFVAEEDPAVDTLAARRYFDAAGSEWKRLIVLDESGHLIPVDYQWRLVVTQMRDFLSRMGGTPRANHSEDHRG